MSTLKVQASLHHPGGFGLEVDFEVPPGITVLFGPSGAGKSTTLSIIAGLIAPESGRVQLDDEVWFDTNTRLSAPPERRRVGYVFQGLALFPHLNVRDNVAFGARGPDREARRGAASQWLRKLELEALADRRPTGLSGGEAQRVALARAFASEPRVLLLDEPFAALDRARRQALAEVVRAYVQDAGIPAIHVTHALEEAEALADRGLRLVDGRIAEAGPIGSVLADTKIARGGPTGGA